MHSSRQWKRRFFVAALMLLIAFAATATATFAWYIYNTNAHTTNVRMAAGTTTSLEISSRPDSGYSSSASLSSFSGMLNPVSTNNILQGFRKVLGFTNGSENHLVARWFGSAEYADFYCTSLYLRAKGAPLALYISNLDYTDSDPDSPISSAIRLGLVVHAPGKQVAAPDEIDSDAAQYIIEINPNDHIQNPDYNTYQGATGYVLDVSSDDPDAVTPFTPLTPECYCTYNADTGIASAEESDTVLCILPFADGQPYGQFVQVDVYIWLEGCDPDCTNEVASNSLRPSTLKDVALSFAGIRAS